MARLKEYNGHYCESEYEYAFIGFLETEGWKYTSGNKLSRVTKRDVLIEDDFKKFIADGNLALTEDEVTQIYDTVRLVVQRVILQHCIRCTTGWWMVSNLLRKMVLQE